MKYSFDTIGDIAILKFPEGIKLSDKKKISGKFLREHKSIDTILEKSDRVKGRLRIAKTRFLAGKNKRETLYRENNCLFNLNVDETYFSPRLAEQRKKVAEDVVRKVSRSKNKILVMFAGVGPFPVVIGKKLKQIGKKAEIVSSEINRKASKFAEENVRLNGLKDYINVIQGDSRKLFQKLKNGKFDFVVMPRPNLKDTFLDVAKKFSKKGTKIYYYGFGKKDEVINEVRRVMGKKARLKISRAGDIAPFKHRWLVEFVF